MLTLREDVNGRANLQTLTQLILKLDIGMNRQANQLYIFN